MITRQASATDLAMFWFGIFFAIVSAAQVPAVFVILGFQFNSTGLARTGNNFSGITTSSLY